MQFHDTALSEKLAELDEYFSGYKGEADLISKDIRALENYLSEKQYNNAYEVAYENLDCPDIPSDTIAYLGWLKQGDKFRLCVRTARFNKEDYDEAERCYWRDYVDYAEIGMACETVQPRKEEFLTEAGPNKPLADAKLSIRKALFPHLTHFLEQAYQRFSIKDSSFYAREAERNQREFMKTMTIPIPF